MTQKAVSVGEVNNYIKNMFDNDYLLRRIRVRGEISNCKYHNAGHIYFTLKDAQGSLNCVMFAGNRRSLRFQLADGMRVVCEGAVSVYEKGGTYQLYVRNVEADGVGELYRRFLMLKDELEEMGMFAPEYKKPIPPYAKKVGIITAPTGAAIRDIIQISTRRNPYVQLILYPALVQGASAAPSIVRGIQTLDAMGLDCLIVGRGGGSLEDLWAFNEREVAEAIFHCNTPIISAVGHETDTTIADLVADLRAPTPSAAAELAVFDVSLILDRLEDRRRHLSFAMSDRLEREREKIERRKKTLVLMHPRAKLDRSRIDCDRKRQALIDAMERILSERRHQLEIRKAKLAGLSPSKRIEQGFAYICDSDGHPIQSIGDLKEETVIGMILRDGSAHAKVIDRTIGTPFSDNDEEK